MQPTTKVENMVKKGFVWELRNHSGDISRRWYFALYDGVKTLKKYEGVNRGTTPEERYKLAKVILSRLNGEQVNQDFSKWLKTKSKQLRPSGMLHYQQRVGFFMEWLGKRPISKATVQAFVQHLYDTDLHQTTINHYITAVKTYLSDTGQTELAALLKKGRTVKTPARYFNKNQVARMKEYMIENEPKLWLYCQLMYYCFLRPAEAAKVRIDDIDTDRHLIAIDGVNAKNEKTAYIMIPVPLRAQLYAHIEGKGGYLFQSSLGNSSMPKKYRDKHYTMLEHLGISNQLYKMYSWRHTGAVNFILNGGHIKHLQVHMRHHSLAQTDQYLRQIGISDTGTLADTFPAI